MWTVVHWLVNALAFWIAFKAVGVPVDDAAPADEVKHAMLAFMHEHGPQPGDSGDADYPEWQGVIDCLQSVGLSGF